ncbi:MAG: LysM peptidoglycan-binding domain-containing protein [Dehalococcoidia bacterium]|nr:LysM peptidoglycan-binding domain-containing protein [Dehalococcoidia bacterium]
MMRSIHGPLPLTLAVLLAMAVVLGACTPEGPATAPPVRGTVVSDAAPTRPPPVPATRRAEPTEAPTAQPTPTPQPTQPPSPDASAPATYTVQPGDVCWRIAQDYSVPTIALLEANPRINANCTNLAVGWELVIP